MVYPDDCGAIYAGADYKENWGEIKRLPITSS
jgi:hypothetical protein